MPFKFPINIALERHNLEVHMRIEICKKRPLYIAISGWNISPDIV